MNFRSRWKRSIAAVMLAGMAASGLAAYAEEAQPGMATPETAAQPTVTATPETAAEDAPAVAAYSMQNVERSVADTPAVAMYAAEDAADKQETIAEIDFTKNFSDDAYQQLLSNGYNGWKGGDKVTLASTLPAA